MTMTKNDTVNLLFEHTRMLKQDCLRLVDSVFEIIKDELEKGNKVSISRFGKWSVHTKRPRRGRNPQTGEPITIAGKRVVTFRCYPCSRNRFNQMDDAEELRLMALPEFTRKLVETKLAEYCLNRIPPEARNKVKRVFRIKGNNVTLVETRPHFRAPSI